jgi:hypothetical protein
MIDGASRQLRNCTDFGRLFPLEWQAQRSALDSMNRADRLPVSE